MKLIKDENKENLQEIFDCLEREVKSTVYKRKIKRVMKNAGGIVGLISSIKGLI